MSEFVFKNFKTPGWVLDKEHCIYYKVFKDDVNIGYVGCQELNHSVGLCNNFCYKTFEEFRNQGLTKKYIKEFITDCPLDLDCIRAKVQRDNIASQKVLEYAGFENRGKREDDKFGFTWKRF